uniref:WH2 domain-containing protein n=1 Tax=Anopheles culicifacies TaxID=139723 RepID=A0A182MDV4_9DIPT
MKSCFIICSEGVLDASDDTASSVCCDKSTSIDEMKDALQAELRNTLKRKIKKQDLEEGDGRKNEEIERSIEHTRNEVQLKLNGPSPTADTPKVDNPLKTIVDIVDKERGVVGSGSMQTSPVANGSLPSGGVVSKTNGGTAFKINSFQSKLPPRSPASDSNKTAGGMSYSNTLPRANGVSSSKALPKTSTGAIPVTYTSSIKVPIGSFEDSMRSTSNTTASPVARNGARSKYEPLTIDTTSNGGSTNSTSSPSTPKELLSPQVRSGTASIRPSQIRTLTKSGNVVSHTDILDTSKPVTKLPVTLSEPAPVLTAAAAVSPPPKVSSTNTTPLPTPPAKEYTPLFEKANKDLPKSPLNRWADSTSVSGGTARKLLLTHGRPNFTIKRSNSRQGFDVDVPNSKNDNVKPVFRILTDLEKMEQQDDVNSRRQPQQQQPSQVVTSPPQQTYVSFAKDLSSAPNNHPDVVVVTKVSNTTTAPTDPFLANLKDIKIDISEMKIVNAKNA